MTKRFLLTIICILMQITSVYAASQLHVVSMQEFKTDKPTSEIKVQVIDNATVGKYNFQTDTILNCKVLHIVAPKRGKRNATFFVQPISYIEDSKKIDIMEEMYGKYSKFVLSKEELKKIPPFTVMKKAALMVGNFFVKGISIAYSFAEGVIKNENNNRIKSGVVNAYEESPLSYIEEGIELDIKTGDDFYFVFTTKEDVQEPNYTYTIEQD